MKKASPVEQTGENIATCFANNMKVGGILKAKRIGADPRSHRPGGSIYHQNQEV